MTIAEGGSRRFVPLGFLPLGWFLGIFWLGEFRFFEILVGRQGRFFLGLVAISCLAA